jgi:hypothetical protein
MRSPKYPIKHLIFLCSFNATPLKKLISSSSLSEILSHVTNGDISALDISLKYISANPIREPVRWLLRGAVTDRTLTTLVHGAISHGQYGGSGP